MTTKVDQLLAQATEHLEQEQHHEAIEVLTEALKFKAKIDDDTISTIYLNMAYSHYMLEQYEKANEYYALGINSPQADNSEYYKYAYSLYAEGRINEAWELLNPKIDEFKDNAYTQQLMGVIEFYKDSPNYKKALKHFKSAEKINKELTDYYHIGECHRMVEEYDKAIKYIRIAMEQYHDDAHLYYSLGFCLKSINKTQEAITAFNKAIEKDSEHSWSYLELGRICVSQKEYEGALPLFQKAIDLGHPDANGELQNLGSIVLGNQANTSTSVSKSSSNSEWQYYDFPEDIAYERLHPKVQKSYKTGSNTFPRKVVFAKWGLIAGLFVIVFAYFFTYRQVKELLPPLDIELVARIDAEFRPICVFDESKNINPTISKGTVLKPIAIVHNSLLVETPWGERGTIDNSYIDKFFQITIPKGTTLFTSNDIYSNVGSTDREMKGVLIVSTKNDNNRFQQVKLENGQQYYIHSVRAISELSKLNLPTYNHKNRRLYHLGTLNKSLKGKKLPDALRKLGAPFGIQYNATTNTQYVVFPFAEVTHNGKRYNRTGIELKNGIIESVKGQGRTEEYLMDNLVMSEVFIKTGIANLWLREFPYFITGKESKISFSFLNDYPWISLVVQIISGIIVIAIIALAVFGLFTLPLLILWPIVNFLGGVTSLPNWVVRWIGYLILAITMILFFPASLVAFNIEWGAFWINVYGLGLIIYFFYLARIYKEYLSCVRCSSCRVLGCARDLGSLYLGLTKEISYEDVYKGSSIEGNVKTNYYERQRKVRNKYFYQDYFGCRICGKYWWWKANSYTMRGDMDHSYPL